MAADPRGHLVAQGRDDHGLRSAIFFPLPSHRKRFKPNETRMILRSKQRVGIVWQTTFLWFSGSGTSGRLMMTSGLRGWRGSGYG